MTIEYDVALVGASPSNLTLAHRLVDLADRPIRIAILEKAKEIGGHLLSGAVSNPRVISKLFPDWDHSDFPLEGVCRESYLTVASARRWESVDRLFMPPYFKKEGYAIINISDMAAYMAKKLAEKAAAKPGVVVDMFPGFPARSVVFEGEGVAGVKVDDTGKPEDDILRAKVTVFGDKGFVSRDLIKKFNLRKNPQLYSVGVKEVWETAKSYQGKVWHTLGYPLMTGHLGGGFIYGCKDNRLIIGMVMALDYANPNIRPPQVLQEFKRHPNVQEMIRGGKLLKYGAAILPEGGYYSLPEKFAVDGAMLVGDALGTLDLKRFSGVDKAMESGYVAAEVIWEAYTRGRFNAETLGVYQRRLMEGWVGRELADSRYYREVFNDYPELLESFIPRIIEGVNSGKSVWYAAMQAGLADIGGAFRLLGARKKMENPSGGMPPAKHSEDRLHIDPAFTAPPRDMPPEPAPNTVYSTADVVFYAHTHYEEGNKHIDEFDSKVCDKCIAQYDAAGKDTPCVGDCTAEVHQTLEKGGKRRHAMALENCVQCTTCEIVCPPVNLRVNAAFHGFGPNFMGL